VISDSVDRYQLVRSFSLARQYTGGIPKGNPEREEPIMNGHGIEHVPGVSLAKITDNLTDWEIDLLATLPKQTAKRTVYPWYPLVGHREGLRMNDPITLHSAFVVISYHGGTVHQTPIPGTVVNGEAVPFRG
jgi:hypothetical protein